MNQENQAGTEEVEVTREITAELVPAELQREWDKLAERARTIHPVVKIGARTDLGRVRENNEDKFDFFEPEDADVLARKGCLYAVADGMGGHAAGQIASELALKTLVKSYYADKSPDVAGSLRRAIREANSLIYDAAQMIVERSGMGTTLTAVVIWADEAYIVNVGDSRTYMIRDGKIRQVTEDHSWVAEQVRRGALTEEEAQYSPFRNVITRSLGNMPTVEADIIAEALQPGDVFVLCSDGLSGSLTIDDIRDVVAGKGPSQAAFDLIDAANSRGGLDNITTILVAIREITVDSTGGIANPTRTDDNRSSEEDKAEEPKKKGLFGLFK